MTDALASHALRLGIVSTPRSGNTWLRHLLTAAYMLEERAAHLPDDVFALPLPHRLALQIHWMRDADFLDRIRRHKIQVITLARHPLDMLLSMLHFLQHEPETARWLDGAGNIDFSLVGHDPNSARFIDYATGPGARNLLQVTAQWWLEPESVKVRYEDLVADPVRQLQMISDFIGQAPVVDFETAVAQNQISKLKSTPNRHAWQGHPGLWRSLMTSATALAISEAHRDLFETLNYECDPDFDLAHEIASERWQSLRIPPRTGGQPFVAPESGLPEQVC